MTKTENTHQSVLTPTDNFFLSIGYVPIEKTTITVRCVDPDYYDREVADMPNVRCAYPGHSLDTLMVECYTEHADQVVAALTERFNAVIAAGGSVTLS